MAVVVTAASGFDLGYVWKNQASRSEPERSADGYYINAARAAWPVAGPGAQAGAALAPCVRPVGRGTRAG
jgi:hypothetical protein